jgi:hypothetical protein
VDNQLELNITIPKNVVLICASNTTLELIGEKDNNYAPLLSRFVEIFIPDMSKELQLKATTEYVKKIYPELTAEDQDFIKDIVYRTTFPGMRELINISNTYVRQLKSIAALQKYKKMETPSEFRTSYLKQLDEQEAARKAAANVISQTGGEFEKYGDDDKNDKNDKNEDKWSADE